jgi:CBS-domain-containing membrane protein
MKRIKVKDMMVNIDDYATVSENATMYDAVIALEKAQEEYDQKQYRHRAILVFNDEKKVVGKLSQLDLIMALEPDYKRLIDVKALSHTGYNLNYIESFSQTGLWKKPLDELCRKAASMEVRNFMYTPDKGEFIDEEAELHDAVHQLIIGKHHSLLVTRGEAKDIAGVLRLTDVFKMVCEGIKACRV